MSINGDPRQRLKQLQSRLKGEVPPVSAGGIPPSVTTGEAAVKQAAPLQSEADPQWQALYEGVSRSVLKLRSTPKPPEA